MTALPRRLVYGTIPNGACHVFVGESPLSACRTVWRDAVVLYNPHAAPGCRRCMKALDFADIPYAEPLGYDPTTPAFADDEDEGPEPEAEREDETP